MLLKTMFRVACVLGAFALSGTAVVAWIYIGAKDRVAANEYESLVTSLQALVPRAQYDNDIATDTTRITSVEFLGTAKPITVYRARKGEFPVAVVLTPVAPNGYSGNIHLMVAIRYDGTLLGVRVLSHRETPGLGDFIELRKSKWINGFDNRSLFNPGPAGWAVKKDGGVFDQSTGATITPRAVVKAVYKCLQYFQQQRELLFIAPASGGTP